MSENGNSQSRVEQNIEQANFPVLASSVQNATQNAHAFFELFPERT